MAIYDDCVYIQTNHTKDKNNNIINKIKLIHVDLLYICFFVLRKKINK